MDEQQIAELIEGLTAADTRDVTLAAVEDLGAAEAALAAVGARLLADADPSDEVLETAQAVSDALAVIREAMSAAQVAADERAERLASLRDGIVGGTEALAADGDADEAVTEGDAPAADEAPAEAAPADEAPAPAETLAVAPPAAPAPAPARPRASLAALQAAAPAEQAPADLTSSVHVRASLDVPGFSVGAQFGSREDLVRAVIARQEALGGVRGGGVALERVPVAQFSYIDDLRSLGGDAIQNGLLLMAAAQPNALTASGGFCAPRETVYDFVKINAPTGLAQDFLPTVGAPRGSVEYPDSPDIRDAFTGSVSRTYTIDNDIAGDNKSVSTIACPTFNTCTVGAQYVILKFGNFGTRAYPEWVAHWVGLAMDAHAHRVSAKLLTQMIQLSNSVVAVGPNAGATSTILSNIGLAAADFRSDLRMDPEAPLEVVLPTWTPDLIRADMARASKGDLETLSITNQMIAGWLAAMNVVPRYVADWQTVSGSATTGATVWPSGLQFLVYPPGTFVKLDMGTLDLGVVRDSTLNTTNDYHIFVETFESVCRPGVESRLYSASICATGAFSSDQNLTCAGIDTPAS